MDTGTGWRAFTPAVQRFFLATVVNMVGSGMFFAFIFIYLNDVRGFSGKATGLAVGVTPLAVVATTPVAGWMSDRFGARRILTAGCLLAIVAGFAYAFVSTLIAALATGFLMGVANGLWFTGQSALLSAILPSHLRPAMSGFQRTALNVGAGVGGVIGGLIVDRSSLVSFQWMFVINALTSVLFLACLPAMPTGRVAHEPGADATGVPEQAVRLPGYREVLRDRFFLGLLASDLGVAFGFGFLFGMMPVYGVKIGISERMVGVLFMIGAVTVVVVQLPMLRWVRGRRRMRCLAVMNALFLVAFVLSGATVSMPTWAAITVLGLGQAVGGFGESILGAVRQPLTADLAPAPLIGRYFGLAAMVFQGSMGAAIALGGVLLDVSLRGIWVVAAVLAVWGLVRSLWLERRIPAHLRLSH